MIGLAIGLFVVGLALVLAEILIPSFGLFTVMCCACFVGSVVAAFSVSSTAGTIFVAAAFVAVPITIAIGFRFLKNSRFGGWLFLSAPDTPESVDKIYEDNSRLVGREGVAVTPLRPSGMAEFDGERIPVVTEGALLDSSRRVQVIAVEGNRIVVRPVDSDSTEEEY